MNLNVRKMVSRMDLVKLTRSLVTNLVSDKEKVRGRKCKSCSNTC